MTSTRVADRLLLGGLLALVFAITGYVALSPPSVIYSVGASTAIRDFSRYAGKAVRVKGMLVPGSVRSHQRAGDCALEFLVLDRADRLRVSHDSCDVPDTFCDLPALNGGQPFSEVQAKGRLIERDGRVELVADRLIMKCPGKYYPPSTPPRAAMCDLYRPGDFCPMCQHAADHASPGRPTAK
jgi:cytochrome c-type biogenesis protein CcmE